MSKIISSRHGVELKELDSSWSPWRYQVNRYVNDGASYGRPGQKTYTSMSNHLTLDAANAAFGG